MSLHIQHLADITGPKRFDAEDIEDPHRFLHHRGVRRAFTPRESQTASSRPILAFPRASRDWPAIGNAHWPVPNAVQMALAGKQVARVEHRLRRRLEPVFDPRHDRAERVLLGAALGDILTFISVVEAGSVTSAARRLNVSKSVISKRLIPTAGGADS